jgi:hypothetical protein
MMIETVGPMTSCMKGQEMYTRSKVKYIKKETMHNITPREEENSIPMVDSEDENKEEVWFEAEDCKYIYVITAHI